MLFTSVWTILAVAYLALSPSRFPRAAHKFAIGAVEFLTMIFWFAAFIAVAVLWGDSWPHGNRYHHNTFYNCGVVAIIFSAFLWLVILAHFLWKSKTNVGIGSLSSSPLLSLRFTCAAPLLTTTPLLQRCMAFKYPGICDMTIE